uniref:Uncharacterized protein n=1 Tax=Eutreptiella gymnastica TaxID=73025 RepID=A0A7S4FV73_9EUGL
MPSFLFFGRWARFLGHLEQDGLPEQRIGRWVICIDTGPGPSHPPFLVFDTNPPPSVIWRTPQAPTNQHLIRPDGCCDGDGQPPHTKALGKTPANPRCRCLRRGVDPPSGAKYTGLGHWSTCSGP